MLNVFLMAVTVAAGYDFLDGRNGITDCVRLDANHL